MSSYMNMVMEIAAMRGLEEGIVLLTEDSIVLAKEGENNRNAWLRRKGYKSYIAAEVYDGIDEFEDGNYSNRFAVPTYEYLDHMDNDEVKQAVLGTILDSLEDIENAEIAEISEWQAVAVA